MMNNQVWRIVAIVGTLLPFVALGYKLFEEESLLTAGLYTGIVVILFATVFLAWRAKPASDDTLTAQDGREAANRS
jgi:hypothetical protein